MHIQHCKKQTLNNVGVLRALADLLLAFSLNMFEHSRCWKYIYIYTNQDLHTQYNRTKFHMVELWNVQRPYIRCLCNHRVVNGCKGYIISFDHVIWIMINKLDIYFLNQSNNNTMFATMAQQCNKYLIESCNRIQHRTRTHGEGNNTTF